MSIKRSIYAPRHGNDRLLLGLKGSLNEYELDLLRQRSLAARYEKARRGELVVASPVGFVKAGDRFEKDPDRRVQAAISLVFDRVEEILEASATGVALVRRAWNLDLPTKQANGDTAILAASRVTPLSTEWSRNPVYGGFAYVYGRNGRGDRMTAAAKGVGVKIRRKARAPTGLRCSPAPTRAM